MSYKVRVVRVFHPHLSPPPSRGEERMEIKISSLKGGGKI